MTQLYPGQMQIIAHYINALNEASTSLSTSLPDVGDGEMVVLGRIEVKSQYGEVIGYLVDEIGGSFSFVGPDFYKERA